MSGAIPPLLQYVFMAWCLVKHRDNFTFYLYNTALHEETKSSEKYEDLSTCWLLCYINVFWFTCEIITDTAQGTRKKQRISY
jgi:hypothetical protein